MRAWAVCALAMLAGHASGATPAASRLTPNLEGQLARPLRYHPEGADFVIENGPEFFNRSLYGGHTAFRADGGDRPEFTLYLPGRGGNLRLGLKTAGGTKWLKDAASIVTRYRPGELIYDIRDPAFDRAVVRLEVLAYAATEGLVVRTTVTRASKGTRLVWAYGGVNGQRGSRDGDIGTEKVPISQYFQFQPGFAAGNSIAVDGQGFTLKSAQATIAGVVPQGAVQHVARGEDWDDMAALFAGGESDAPVVVGEVPVVDGRPLYLSLQRVGATAGEDLAVYKAVSAKVATAPAAPLLPVFAPAELPARFAEAEAYFKAIRERVRIDTPDPYLNASVGALNVAADALWDDQAQAIMHGAIAWRTALLGWRGPYALDDLGTHDRARRNFDSWTVRQNTAPVPDAVPPADATANLSRNEAGLHSNGDLSGSHYDMNLVFMDALFRHILWMGDADYARRVWPVIERHMAWEKRLFRREYGADKLPLYEAYAAIWASDGLYNSGAGSAYASAYNLYANRMAARIAVLAGVDPAPHTTEADAIGRAMRQQLWMADEGTFAETRDISGNGLLHKDYALWNAYHTIDEQAVTPREAWSMAEALKTHFRPLPVTGPGVPAGPWHVYATSDWMPYTWSINNVVMDENTHTALALWQASKADDAYALLKGAVLASQYMGITPGNLGTMNYLDVYRRESQRDFGDSAGTLSRAVVEGLFGVRPDALKGEVVVTPGFPAVWDHASLEHPDIGVAFRRSGLTETWTIRRAERFRTLKLVIPARFGRVALVTVNGRTAGWTADADAVGRPMLTIATDAGPIAVIRIRWAGDAIGAGLATGLRDGDFEQRKQGGFSWWAFVKTPVGTPAAVASDFDWNAGLKSQMETVDLTTFFNDDVSAIFAPGKYLSPRPATVSLTVPSQGFGEWTHPSDMPVIDDSGLRRVAGRHDGQLIMPDGVPFATPPSGRNIAFVSQWDNFPRELTVPLSGQARHLYLLMAGTTNHQQSRMDNGEVVVAYTDGTTARLPLRNPETWWPIEADYFIDDYQFPFDGPLPARIDLKTGAVRVLDASFKGQGRDVPGGAATALQLPLDAGKTLKSLTVRAIANEVVIGLMGATLER